MFLVRFGKHGKLGRLFSAKNAGFVLMLVPAHGQDSDRGLGIILDLGLASGVSAPAGFDETALLFDKFFKIRVVLRLVGVFLAEGQGPVEEVVLNLLQQLFDFGGSESVAV